MRAFWPALLLLLTAAVAQAHEVLLLRADLTARGQDIDLTVAIRQDQLLAALGRGGSLFADAADLRAAAPAIAAYAQPRLHLAADGAAVPLAYAPADATDAELPDVLPLRFTGRFAGDPAHLALSSTLLAGASPLGVVTSTAATWRGTALPAHSVADATTASWDLPHGGMAADPTGSFAFLDFIRIGFAHIIPEGLDHILFVLGLFLVARDVRSLLACVTAFTVAHSLTLGLAMTGLVVLPERLVEPLIALSIAAIALERFLFPGLDRWRWLVVFAFGLIHGLGFASALRDLDLVRGGILVPLVGFNVGVEAGQLAVLALAGLATAAVRRWRWYDRCVATPAVLAIAATGVFWTVERAFGG